ncbi:MAG: hypothetical protein A2W86_11565 [Bacteroidetes bacterium GWD2_45_23]|nr:MAG: hypothetical protein A2W87_08450 [Bacteroidetes bacterium GWC2_46_850]OFX78631.1 MAG: hypothetical protein A2071_11550 [Bacteroidetes bacterium GWC1_47_7]OFX85463.1 MAG: hypothetical protein A2W86_11565 [Bacteroidetes bacterium GWD2_45_23]HBB00682.1 hypothetical protein [Porphyromonadaceae bacterium]HCC19307.1 hypothetical protein [Porphyromonadaceae bacterium]
MRSISIILNLILALIISGHNLQAQDNKSKEYLENIKRDSIDGVYIPIDLKDCFNQIDFFWTDSVKTEVREKTEDDFTIGAHFGIGLWMRNNWRLWTGSRLSRYFNDLGIIHPDDMSTIILTSYHRYLLRQDIKLEEQIDYYKEYWKKQR